MTSAGSDDRRRPWAAVAAGRGQRLGRRSGRCGRPPGGGPWADAEQLAEVVVETRQPVLAGGARAAAQAEGGEAARRFALQAVGAEWAVRAVGRRRAVLVAAGTAPLAVSGAAGCRPGRSRRRAWGRSRNGHRRTPWPSWQRPPGRRARPQAQRRMLGRGRLQRGPVQRHVAEPRQPQPERQDHRLLEDRRKRGRGLAPEPRHRPVVRPTTPGQGHERRLLARQPRQLPRRPHAVQLAPRENAELRRRMVGLLALRARRDHDVPQVHRPYQITEHVDRVFRRQRILQADPCLHVRSVRLIDRELT